MNAFEFGRLVEKMAEGISEQSTTRLVGGIPVMRNGQPLPLTAEQRKQVDAARHIGMSMGNPDPLAGVPGFEGPIQRPRGWENIEPTPPEQAGWRGGAGRAGMTGQPPSQPQAQRPAPAPLSKPAPAPLSKPVPPQPPAPQQPTMFQKVTSGIGQAGQAVGNGVASLGRGVSNGVQSMLPPKTDQQRPSMFQQMKKFVPSPQAWANQTGGTGSSVGSGMGGGLINGVQAPPNGGPLSAPLTNVSNAFNNATGGSDPSHIITTDNGRKFNTQTKQFLN